MKKTATTKKVLYITAFIAFCVLLWTASGSYLKKESAELKVFQVENGWGYDISVKGKPFIHQPYIPVISGEKPFRSEAEARRTGELVVQKIKQKQIPSLTKEDLSTVGIQVPE